MGIKNIPATMWRGFFFVGIVSCYLVGSAQAGGIEELFFREILGRHSSANTT